MLGHEFVIRQARIRISHGGNSLGLTEPKQAIRGQTPPTFEKTIAPEDLVNARNTTGIVMGHIEDRRIHFGDLSVQPRRYGLASARFMAAVQHFDRFLRPVCPVSQQSAHNSMAANFELPVTEQVRDDVVVVAGAECDLASSAGLGYGPHHVERLEPIKGPNLNGHNIVDRSTALPEVGAELSATGTGLEVETEQRDHFPNLLAVFDQQLIWQHS